MNQTPTEAPRETVSGAHYCRGRFYWRRTRLDRFANFLRRLVGRHAPRPDGFSNRVFRRGVCNSTIHFNNKPEGFRFNCRHCGTLYQIARLPDHKLSVRLVRSRQLSAADRIQVQSYILFRWLGVKTERQSIDT